MIAIISLPLALFPLAGLVWHITLMIPHQNRTRQTHPCSRSLHKSSARALHLVPANRLSQIPRPNPCLPSTARVTVRPPYLPPLPPPPPYSSTANPRTSFFLYMSPSRLHPTAPVTCSVAFAGGFTSFSCFPAGGGGVRGGRQSNNRGCSGTRRVVGGRRRGDTWEMSCLKFHSQQSILYGLKVT